MPVVTNQKSNIHYVILKIYIYFSSFPELNLISFLTVIKMFLVIDIMCKLVQLG